MKPITEEERKILAEGFLARVKAVKAAPPVNVETETGKATAMPVSGSELFPGQVQVLMFAGTGRIMPVSRMYEQLCLTRAQGSKLVGDLERKGRVIPHLFSTGQRGGPVTILEVTDQGWEELKKRGIDRPVPRTEGGWEHNLAAILIGEEGERQGMRVRYEVDLQ
jgi:hypothetical protein